MPARRDQLWQGMCWQVCAQIASGRPCTSLAGGRGGKMHFLGEQFPHQKMLPQRDFAAFLAGGFSVAGVRKAAAPGTSAEARVPGNCSPVIIRAIPLIRGPGAY